MAVCPISTWPPEDLPSLSKTDAPDLSVLIAKYYLPNELLVDQVEEVIDMLTEELAQRFSPIQAVNKANSFIAKYYLNLKI